MSGGLSFIGPIAEFYNIDNCIDPDTHALSYLEDEDDRKQMPRGVLSTAASSSNPLTLREIRIEKFPIVD